MYLISKIQITLKKSSRPGHEPRIYCSARTVAILTICATKACSSNSVTNFLSMCKSNLNVSTSHFKHWMDSHKFFFNLKTFIDNQSCIYAQTKNTTLKNYNKIAPIRKEFNF